MHTLPGELLPSIFSFLPWHELLQTSTVCITFRNKALCSFKDLRKDQLQKILAVILSSRPNKEDAKAAPFQINTTRIEKAATFVQVNKRFEMQINKLFQPTNRALLSQNKEKKAMTCIHLLGMVKGFSETTSLLWRPAYLTHLLFKIAINFECADNLQFRSDEEKRAVVSSVFKDFIITIQDPEMAEYAISFLSFDDAKELCLECGLDGTQQQEIFFQAATHLYDRGKYIHAHSFAKEVTIRNDPSDALFFSLSTHLSGMGKWSDANTLAYRISDIKKQRLAFIYMELAKWSPFMFTAVQ